MNVETPPGIGRRGLLVGAAAWATSLGVQPATGRLRPRRPSPNEKVDVAVVGAGPQGGQNLDALLSVGANIVALCDVDHGYSARRLAQFPSARRFKDYRVMLDQMGKSIDAVLIATPDHTHAVITMEAMQRGKHVYCEKPLAHTVHEVRALMSAARKHKVVTQMGNQGHAYNSIRDLVEWVRAGLIGQVHTIHAGSAGQRELYCHKDKLPRLRERFRMPPGLAYDLWLGPAQYRPYTPFWVHNTWRGWLPFGSGSIGDWFCHVIDPSFWALDLGAPTSVRAEVKDYTLPADALTYPAATKITFEFPARRGRAPVKLVWFDGEWRIPTPRDLPRDDELPDIGAVLFGQKGMIVHGSHGAEGRHLQPEALREAYFGRRAPAKTIPRIRGHHRDWLDAIREGRQAGSPFEYGGRLTQVALLGVIAVRFPGQTLRWDDDACRFTNNRAANAFLNPPYRKGWAL